jgi:hypothetical protein
VLLVWKHCWARKPVLLHSLLLCKSVRWLVTIAGIFLLLV